MAYETSIIGREGVYDRKKDALSEQTVYALAVDPPSGLKGYGEADNDKQAIANAVSSLERSLREKAEDEESARLRAEQEAAMVEEFEAFRAWKEAQS